MDLRSIIIIIETRVIGDGREELKRLKELKELKELKRLKRLNLKNTDLIYRLLPSAI
jgi:hypothetical protein